MIDYDYPQCTMDYILNTLLRAEDMEMAVFPLHFKGILMKTGDFFMTNDEFILKLSREYYGRLYRYVNKICSNKELVADIVHDTFVIAYEKADQLKHHENIAGWLYVTARKRMLKLLEQEQHFENLEDLADSLETEDDVIEQCIEKLDLYPAVEQHLKTEEFALLMRYYKEGYEYRELAAESQVTEASIKMKIRRIVEKVKSRLCNYEESEQI